MKKFLLSAVALALSIGLGHYALGANTNQPASPCATWQTVISNDTTYTVIPNNMCQLIMLTNAGTITVTLPGVNQLRKDFTTRLQASNGGDILVTSGSNNPINNNQTTFDMGISGELNLGPSQGQILQWYAYTSGPGGAGSGGINQLTGDVVAGPGTGSQAATLSNSGVSPNTYGDSTHVGQCTFDSKGRATSCSNVAISSGGTGTVTTTGSPASGNLSKFSGTTSITNADLTGDVTTSGGVATTLANSGVAAATYGDATHSPQCAFDVKGRATSCSNVSITQPTGANPTASVGTSVVNGSASTFMRSDAAPPLANSGVSAATYGDSTHVPQCAFDAKGRATSCSNVSISASSTTVTLNPGLASDPSTYNSGAQTITDGSTLSTQLTPTSKATSYSVQPTDTARLLYATAGSVTFTTPNPGVTGNPSFQFGSDGSHAYTITSTGGTATFYGSVHCTGGTSVTPPVNTAIQILDDGTNFQCFELYGGPALNLAGTATMGTSAIGSGVCSSAVTVGADGVATTDVIGFTFNADPTSTTGYSPSASGGLYIVAYPTSNNVNFKACNSTGGSITPGAVTVNWSVVRK